MIQIAFNSYWLSNMVNVQGDANGISGKGCTGACNAVNTTLTTDAQLQNQGERLLGALGLAEKLRSPAAHCLKASPFICWVQPAAPAFWPGCQQSGSDLVSFSMMPLSVYWLQSYRLVNSSFTSNVST